MRNLSLWVGILGLMLVLGACKSTKKASTDAPSNPNTVADRAPTPPSTEAAVPQADPIPFDPKVRTGVLANGMRYYVRQNSKPENYAELRLALNAGSLLETDEQQGLAHFVEHMAFNGTKNFPKMALVDYLESIGTKFGAHLNAYTSFDETVYQLRIPTDNEEQFTKGLLILQDWAGAVTFDPEEIDKERGVVISEWRSSLGGDWRLSMQTLPKTFYNSRYAERLPIGKVPVLESFKPETLVKYYRNWYRPDLMAIVAVGDFDAAEVEKQIKAQFSALPKAENPKPRPSFEVPNHAETLVAIASDEEARFNQIQLQYKHPRQALSNLDEYRANMVRTLASSIMTERLQALTQQEKPPFNYVFSGYGAMARTKDSYRNFAIVPNNGFEAGLKALLMENERARRFGFTQSEVERNKKSILSRLEKSFREADKTESRNLAQTYVSHYLSQRPVPGIEKQLALYKKFFPTITLAEVNAAFKAFLSEENRVVALTGPKKENNAFPEEETVRQLLKAVPEMELEPYEDEVSDQPLMSERPQPGKVADQRFDEKLGLTTLTLSNGVKVLLMPTDFKNDEIRMQAFSWGGTSLYPDEAFMSADMASQLIGQSGVGDFDNIQLDKYLSDKVVRLSPFIASLYEGMQGNCSPQDLETFLQLVHLYFTRPRQDETAFAASMARTKAIIANQMASPEGYFQVEVNRILTQDHFREQFPTEALLEQVKLAEAYRIYQERFAHAGDFTFIFVGNFEVETLKPMLATYLGSLPAQGEKESWKDVGSRSLREPVSKEFFKGKEPKSMVLLSRNGDFDWDSNERFQLDAAIRVLRIMLRESMREDKGGVYGVGAFASTERDPKSEYEVMVQFFCDPKDAADLMATAFQDISDLRTNGPSEKNMEKVKETLRKDLAQNKKENRYWISYLYQTERYGFDPHRIEQSLARIDALTAEQVQAAAKRYLDPEQFARFVLYPEKDDR